MGQPNRQKTIAKFDQELEIIKAKNSLLVEEFKRRSDANLKDLEQFGTISSKNYQNFFENRISTYLKLLKFKMNTFYKYMKMPSRK